MRKVSTPGDRAYLVEAIPVKSDKDFHFNHSMRFVFLEDCYSRPVALWPFDPLHRLEPRDPKRGWFHVIDRNQSELDD